MFHNDKFMILAVANGSGAGEHVRACLTYIQLRLWIRTRTLSDTAPRFDICSFSPASSGSCPVPEDSDFSSAYELCPR